MNVWYHEVMKRSGACSWTADELRGPRADCSFSQVEKVSYIARPHPVPLLQERGKCLPHYQHSSDWVYRTRIATHGGGGKPFLLLGGEVRMRASHDKPGMQ